MPAQEDRDVRYCASLAFPPQQHVRTTLQALADDGAPMSTAALETYVDLSRTRLETMLKVLDVDGAVQRVRGGWTATGQEWAYDQERYDRVKLPRDATNRPRCWPTSPLTAAGCGSCASSSTTPPVPRTAGGATTAPASSCHSRSPGPPSNRLVSASSGPA